jgi:HK97 family phage major capsid protein
MDTTTFRGAGGGLYAWQGAKVVRSPDNATSNSQRIKLARQRTSECSAEMRHIMDAYVDQKKPLAAIDKERMEELGTEMDRCTLELDAARTRADQERNDPNAKGPGGMALDPIGSQLRSADPRSGRRGATYAQLFGASGLSMEGWTTPDEFLAVVLNGLSDSRLQAATMTEGVGSAGGFAVPTELAGRWLDLAIEDEIVRPLATTWPMASAERAVPCFDAYDRSGGDLAGLEIQWLAEAGTGDLQAAKLDLLTLRARAGAIFVEASNQLRADGVNFDTQLENGVVKAMSFGLDRNFLFGLGSNQPLGALASVNSALIVVAKETSQIADTITYTNLLKMFSRLTPGSVSRSMWVAHPSTIPQLATLSIAIGTSGSHVPVMTESNGQFTILTRPVRFTEKAKPLGDQGDISLVDFTQYAVGLRQGMVLERSQHVGFMRNVETYRLLIRIDGQPTWKLPVTPVNGAETLSPYITLADRA